MSNILLSLLVMILSHPHPSGASTSTPERHRIVLDDCNNRIMNSRTALFVCAFVCIVVFFYFMLSVVCRAGRTSMVSNLSPTESIREAIAATLSKFQRRALLESFFSEDKEKTKRMIIKHENPEGSDRGGSIVDCSGSIAATPRSTNSDEESPLTPLTRPMEDVFSPGSSALSTPGGLSPPSLTQDKDCINVPQLKPRFLFPIPSAATLDNLDSDLKLEPSNEDTDATMAHTGTLFKDEGNPKEDGGNLKEDDSLQEDVCSICLDAYDNSDGIVISKHCIHAFHRECIMQWLELKKSNYKCPCCRNDMITNDELREAAFSIVGKQKMESAMRHIEAPTTMLGPVHRPTVYHTSRRRPYSDESPVFIPDL